MLSVLYMVCLLWCCNWVNNCNAEELLTSTVGPVRISAPNETSDRAADVTNAIYKLITNINTAAEEEDLEMDSEPYDPENHVSASLEELVNKSKNETQSSRARYIETSDFSLPSIHFTEPEIIGVSEVDSSFSTGSVPDSYSTVGENTDENLDSENTAFNKLESLNQRSVTLIPITEQTVEGDIVVTFVPVEDKNGEALSEVTTLLYEPTTDSVSGYSTVLNDHGSTLVYATDKGESSTEAAELDQSSELSEEADNGSSRLKRNDFIVQEEMRDTEILMRGWKRLAQNPEQLQKYFEAVLRSEKSSENENENIEEYLELPEIVNKEKMTRRSGPVQENFETLSDLVGIPGEDYPNYQNIPATSFTCKGKKIPGLFADVETRCQVFHACWQNQMESYLCPIGTTFNQRILSCDSWSNSTCSLSPDFYYLNYRLDMFKLKDDYSDDYRREKYEDYSYVSQLSHSHPIFNEMKIFPVMYKNTAYSHSASHSGRSMDSNLEYEDNMPNLSDSPRDAFVSLLNLYDELKASGSSKTDSEFKERMHLSKADRSGSAPVTTDDSRFKTTPVPGKNVGKKSTKMGKEQIAPAIVFKVLDSAKDVVNKGVLPLTREMLATSYSKLYKKKLHK